MTSNDSDVIMTETTTTTAAQAKNKHAILPYSSKDAAWAKQATITFGGSSLSVHLPSFADTAKLLPYPATNVATLSSCGVYSCGPHRCDRQRTFCSRLLYIFYIYFPNFGFSYFRPANCKHHWMLFSKGAYAPPNFFKISNLRFFFPLFFLPPPFTSFP